MHGFMGRILTVDLTTQTTTVVTSGYRAEVDGWGNIVLTHQTHEGEQKP